ncbi:MAG: aconitase X catalytic domain-containing protein [Acidimicrobiia bacterium]|nr:aconitase X catalytic domain-containing protein [Actinomycetota bacterium]MBL6925089.1 aconitase X catalytic domain-containing protein [Acidimicrobiia bacterium]MBL6927079.1 aconitase X catalytic domain-containing protein [Acidimicrobiia bacterium]
MDLSAEDRQRLAGDAGPAAQLAMRIVVRLAESMGVGRLLDITGAHVDSCLYHGQSGLDFAGRLLDGGASVAVPTTLNVASMDLAHPELFRGDEEQGRSARCLAGMYEQMGCQPTWTCAPYHLENRPSFGENVAWAESNAIVFANSVLGARTARYGDLIDISAAITGRVPAAGLHLDENRHATIQLGMSHVPPDLMNLDQMYPVLGTVVGAVAGSRIPVIEGLPPGQSEDRLRALGAGAASSGSVGMFHAVGSTPEAPTLEAALGGRAPAEVVEVSIGDLRAARDSLCTANGKGLASVCLGTPHYSIEEFRTLVSLIEGRHVHPEVALYVSTGRAVVAELELRGWADALRSAGVTLVVDTCTYMSPVLADTDGTAMTDSAKWAWYAPGNLGVDVIFAGTAECVDSAIAGRVLLDNQVWADV